LFIYSSLRDCPFPPRLSGCPTLFAMCLFWFFHLLVYYSVCFFSVFPGWESVCPGGYADLAHVCLWEYHMPLSSPGGLLLPSRLGSGVWQCGALLVSPFTVEWRCYVQAGVVEMSKFYVFLVVFLARCSPRSLQDFTLGSMLSASSSSHQLGILP
jgi:hypothetical protein